MRILICVLNIVILTFEFLKYGTYLFLDEEIIDTHDPIKIETKGLDGNKELLSIHKKGINEIWEIKTRCGKVLRSSASHMVYRANGSVVEISSLKKHELILTNDGFGQIEYSKPLKRQESVFDLTINSEYHEYFSNDILSHQSIVTAIYIVHYILTHKDRNIMVLSQNGDKVKELVDKIMTIIENLPFYMKPGIIGNSVMTKEFDNGIKLVAQTTTQNTGASFTIHLLYADEFALIHHTFLDKFYRTIYPTLSSSDISQIIITSTPRGMNKFWEIYTNAVEGKNNYHPIRVDWWQVPKKILDDGTEIPRDDEWKADQIADLGSEEDFNQEYGNQFLAGATLLFKYEDLKIIKSNEKEYIHHEIPILDDLQIFYEGIIKFHPQFNIEEFKKESSKFVLSLDLGGGDGGDYTVCHIFQVLPMSKAEIENLTIFSEEKDFFKLVQIGMIRSNSLSIPEFAKVMYYFVVDFMLQDNVHAIIEINYEGNYLISEISKIEGEDNRFDSDAIIVKFKHKMESEKEKDGLKINKSIKNSYCKVLRTKVRNKQIIFNEKLTIEEASSFARTEGGTYKGQLAHDDTTMAIVNVVPYVEKSDFVEMIESMLFYCPKEFIKLVGDMLKREIVPISPEDEVKFLPEADEYEGDEFKFDDELDFRS